MKKNITITLEDHFEIFIQLLIKNGRYSSKSEVVRAGLILLEEEEKLKALRLSLIEGEQSGFEENFDPNEFKAKMIGRYHL